MTHRLHVVVPLTTDDPEHRRRLTELQAVFAQACNLLAPLVRQHRCWNRVALHHLAYRQLRQALPQLGSQMACNAIYSVCRTARLVYQHPNSPFALARWGERPLPLLRFAPDCPVYFDRHTLSVRPQGLSLFTLDGRMRFDLSLPAQLLQAIATMRLREVVLNRSADGGFRLAFSLSAAAGDAPTEDEAQLWVDAGAPVAPSLQLPSYLDVEVSHESV